MLLLAHLKVSVTLAVTYPCTSQPWPVSTLDIEQVKQLFATKRCARALLINAAKQTGHAPDTQMTVDTLQGILRVEENTFVRRRELTSTLRALAQCRMQSAECRILMRNHSSFFILHSAFFILHALPLNFLSHSTHDGRSTEGGRGGTSRQPNTLSYRRAALPPGDLA